MPEIDLGALECALSQLRIALEYVGSEQAKQDSTLAQVFRSAAIQAFEFTYELSHKLLRRYLAATAPFAGQINEMPFGDLIRMGYARGIIKGEWDDWKEFRRLRSLTSHSYGESCAIEVSSAIPKFADEVAHLLTALRNNPP